MRNKLKSLKNNYTFMKYFKNTSWLFGARIFRMGVGFFVIILMTRYLGPDNFGLLSYSQSFVALFVAMSTLGLEVILTRELTKNKSETDLILGTAIVLKLVASVLAFLCIVGANIYIDDDKASRLTNIIAFTIFFQSINLGIDTYFQANIISKYSSISKTVVYILSTILKLSLIYFEAELIYFAYVLVFDAIITFIGYLYIYSLQKKNILSLRFSTEKALFLLKSGLPMLLVSMAVFFYTKIDQIMIKFLLDNEAVGHYAAAIKVSELFYFIPLLITQSVFPKIIQEKESGNNESYFKLLLNIYKIVLWISLAIVVIIVSFSDLIVDILFGAAFAPSAGILSVLTYSLILVSIGSVNTKILYAEHLEKKYLYRSIFGIVVNIGLNYLLIPIYGAVGAAIATLATLITIHYIYDLFDRDLWKFYHLKLWCFIPINLAPKKTNKKGN
ncbi:MAG: flippase [Rhizobiales bacterium]|nr:flippase [Hyphomicrobiales bacterium]NRB14943.1 flippase [Hyphomicrobiales bacterium]